VLCQQVSPPAWGAGRGGIDLALDWSRAASARLRAVGASVLVHAGGLVVASFEPSELADVLELALDLAAEAPVPVGIAVALGDLGIDDGVPSGPALERAHYMAVRLAPGAIALDRSAAARAGRWASFLGQVALGARVRAVLLDRAAARPDPALARRWRPQPAGLPPSLKALLPSLEAVLGAEGRRPTVVLRGAPSSDLRELLDEVLAKRPGGPELVVARGTVLGALPLGSLRATVRAHDLADAARPLHRETFAQLELGWVPAREAVVAALSAVVPPSVVLLERPSEIDPATLDVWSAVAAQREDVSLVLHEATDQRLPASLDASAAMELPLPAIRESDARFVAAAVLGPAEPNAVAFVAALGGEGPLGVAAAARLLAARGDLVGGQDDITTLRAGLAARLPASAPLPQLLAECLDRLEDGERPSLEAMAVMAEPAVEAEVLSVLNRDGLPPAVAASALAGLREAGWIERVEFTSGASLSWVSGHLRALVAAGLHPARAAELHRFAFETLEGSPSGQLRRTELALHRVLGGQERAGGMELLDAAAGVRLRGYPRAASRLARVAAAAAPELLDEASRFRLEDEPVFECPARVAEHDEEEFEPPFEAPAPTAVGAQAEDGSGDGELARELAAALRARDAERIEAVAQRALLEGAERSEVARFRAVADLVRGDVEGAARGLSKARSLQQAAPVDRRALLTEATVSLRGGAALNAVRLALRALAEARDERDARGESVAFSVLAASYRALGRDDDALRLERRANA